MNILRHTHRVPFVPGSWMAPSTQFSTRLVIQQGEANQVQMSTHPRGNEGASTCRHKSLGDIRRYPENLGLLSGMNWCEDMWGLKNSNQLLLSCLGFGRSSGHQQMIVRWRLSGRVSCMVHVPAAIIIEHVYKLFKELLVEANKIIPKSTCIS